MPGPAPDPTVRDRILDAARVLLARRGYRAMTIEAIALEAGIGKGSVYLHFRSKEDVALSYLDRMVEDLLARSRVIAARRAPAARRLAAMLRLRVLHRFDHARAHSHSLDALLAAVRPRLLERREGYFRDEAEVLAAVIADGQRRGEFTAAPAGRVARAFVTATNALLPYSLSVRELGRRAQIVRRTDDVTCWLLAGLTTRRVSR